MKSMDLGRITLPCPSCGGLLRIPRGETPRELRCLRCAERIPSSGGPPIRNAAPPVCHICGSPHLYWQKDFNQKAGCLIVLLGALLVPWTYGLSLAVVALIDLALYRLLPRISVCYVCRARYRGVPPHPEHAPYDLVTAQTWEARSINWTEGRLRPAFSPEEARPGAKPVGPG